MHVSATLIGGRAASTGQWDAKDFQQMVPWRLIIHRKKVKLKLPRATLKTNKQKRWIEDLNVKGKAIVVLAANISEYLYDLGVGRSS